MYMRRRIVSMFHMTMAHLVTLLGVAMLAWILWSLFGEGFSAISVKLFTEMTPPPGSDGGLLNAIVGSLMMVGIATILGIPVGLFVGTYLAEYGRYSKISSVVRFINDILLSAPSILIGLFVYELVVVPMGHFSGYAGAIALAVIALPVVVRTSEDMLLLVPDSLREAAAALGIPRWRIIMQVSYRAAGPGLMTGALLAVARISGETAPLLFTSLNNQFWSANLNKPMANLPVVIFNFAMSPYDDWRSLAWAGALLITLAVLGLTIAARTLLAAKSRMKG
ncbi:phosphate ABC transporter, permease protein PstA [Thalassospira marina]|uniref:Phosphate transport system permease protein PstA n=2 Tax=Thalassospira marina TaxID=2048283 RepID=A0A2N3L0B6_9PROT|nr:phosphate ABC transporter, permease protein PstA [Thalassospira marina]PKR56255.1 phosphate ABC transporter, permease protein PstA [Thalassospira marina]